ncbi:MAG: HEPN domain-containing protein [Oscillospiraceae bacterium]
MSRRQRFNNASNDSRKYFDWLDRAGEDMICANILSNDERLFNSAAFHCQQAIEKALKGYILLKSGELVDGHNLTWLCKRAMRYDKEFTKWLDESTSLNRCYIETRYPSDVIHEISFKKIKKYYNMAHDMYLFICEQVDDELEEREEEIDLT